MVVEYLKMLSGMIILANITLVLRNEHYHLWNIDNETELTIGGPYYEDSLISSLCFGIFFSDFHEPISPWEFVGSLN